jgi:hypothetical protein
MPALVAQIGSDLCTCMLGDARQIRSSANPGLTEQTTFHACNSATVAQYDTWT